MFARSAFSRPIARVSVPKRNFSFAPTPENIVLGIALIGAPVSAVAWAVNRYKIASPDQYLVRTGVGIKDIAISKQGVQWPLQKYKFVDVHPKNYSFDLQSMSNEMIPFMLPATFTIGPKNDVEALTKYVRLLENVKDIKVNKDKDGKEKISTIDSIILGIIEGETRTISSKMAMKDIFNNRASIKENILKGVQEELDDLGLHIYNVNIRELEDSKEYKSNYFESMRKKKLSETDNQAKVDVAEADKTGKIGETDREMLTRQEVAKLKATTITLENTKLGDIAESNAILAVKQAVSDQKSHIAQVEAIQNVAMRDTDLQKDLEQKRIAMETEKMRAVDVVKATVSAEANIKDAEGHAKAVQIEADAKLYAKRNEAFGIQAVFEAEANGLDRVMKSFNGNSDAYAKYLMIQKDVYVKLAHENAHAIQGLQPKIVEWRTGSGGNSNAIADVLKMIPPILTTLDDQAGIKPPKWMMDTDGLGAHMEHATEKK